MDVTIATDRIEFSTRTYAYGIQGTDISKVSYARLQSSSPNWYEVYVDRKSGERIVIDLRTPVPSFPAWTNNQAGAEQAVVDITAVAGVCCDGGGGGVGIVELTGDVLAGPGTGTVPAVLATIGAFAGSYTDPILTVDNKGRITAITSGPGDDHLVLASATDTTPGTLKNKLEIVNATAAIINGGADEILRFTPSGGGGGTGAFPIALYRDAGVNTLPMDGSWLDIVLSVALQTAADIVRTGAEFEFQSDGTYFVGFKMTADTGASRAQHKVRLVVDAGGGYAEVDSSIGYTFTPNTSDDLQMAYTGLIPIVAVAGDKIKAQGAASSGTVDIDTLGAGTAIVIFRMQTDAGATVFTDLTDVPNSYSGQALKSVRVNAAETGLEFFTGGGGGTGTVTSVSVVSANGLAGTVATATTTPAITLSTTVTGILEGNGTAISAASTTGTGAVVLATSPTLVTPALGTPSALVGTNITGTATGLTAGAVVADGVTNAMLADVPASTFKGSPVGAGTVNPIDLTANQASTILDTATDPFVRTSALPPDTGITQLTGDVTAGPGSGSQVATIAADSVTNAKLADVPAATFKGSPVGAGTVNPVDLTANQASTILDSATDPFTRLSLFAPSFINYTGGSVATTSTSLADVHSSAEWTIPSTGLFQFEFFITHNAAATSTGAFFSLNGTATYSYLSCGIGYSTLSTDRGNFQIRNFNAGVAASSSLVTSGNPVLMTGTINVTATGTLLLRFATEVAGSAITVTNVYGLLRKIY